MNAQGGDMDVGRNLNWMPGEWSGSVTVGAKGECGKRAVDPDGAGSDSEPTGGRGYHPADLQERVGIR